jgi:trehalose-phosphatase
LFCVFSANSVLWSLLHYSPLPELRGCAGQGCTTYDLRLWEAYKEANRMFADVVLKEYRSDQDLVWVHDYHLFLLPELLRASVTDMTIGFFLHTTFPSSEIFRILPHRREILQGVLASDLIGFHTYDYARHFTSSCARLLGVSARARMLEYQGRMVSLGINPIGIDTDHFGEVVRSEKVQQRKEQLLQQFGHRKIILGVDRLDPIKGLPLRLHAFERFLAENREWRDRVVLVQIAVPSRTDVPEYEMLYRHVNEQIGRINGQYGSLGAMPVHYLFQSVAFDELCALYAAADVCLVTSIRDGMNLVAEEFIACQPITEEEMLKRTHADLNDSVASAGSDSGSLDVNAVTASSVSAPTASSCGVLVISEFAGCAQSLAGALRINPWNTEEVSTAIKTALEMNEQEKMLKQEGLYRYVCKHNASFWGETFLRELRLAHARSGGIHVPLPLPVDKVIAQYEATNRRLLVFDYDGTLAEYQSLPQLAKPKKALLATLRRLASDPKNHVVVVSGCSRRLLSKWLGHVENLHLAAENGIHFREWGRSDFELTLRAGSDQSSDAWKLPLLDIFNYYSERTPGSFVEVKDYTITFHYREADPEFGLDQAHELHTHLEEIARGYEVIVGNKIVEAVPIGGNKRSLMEYLLKRFSSMQKQASEHPTTGDGHAADGVAEDTDRHRSTPDFLLFCGDDNTDEEVFRALAAKSFKTNDGELMHLPQSTTTVCVGGHESAAKYTVRAHQGVLDMMDRMAQSSSASSPASSLTPHIAREKL